MEPNPEVAGSAMGIPDTCVKKFYTWELKSKKLPVRTGRIPCLPAWGCVPVARGSSPCGWGGTVGGSAKVSPKQKISIRWDSRFGGVHGSGGVADVLRALEHPEGQAVEEVPGRQQACHWAQLETSLLWREQRHLG